MDTIIPFGVENIRNGVDRPTIKPNAWVADISDKKPVIELGWDQPQYVREINLVFDTDTDHPMESVLMTHPETVMPFCVRNYYIEDDQGRIVYQKKDNFQTINKIVFDEPVVTQKLHLIMEHPSAQIAASIFSIRCYS
ncbi:hypothetical protein [Niabella ginsengisoli]|uniref:Uncharacterized protein n=1 Tax=Niabella ginsengisoli TaxID=522298 RepID=A0ABS9SJ60_9BACT|nr:hypothetical protein [Niabella ginsengisoli]MCH5598394.1 hypothetical protein [Niabella ginsengisoli]